MESMRQSCRPKHQVLILKCYPRYQKGVQEVEPNASELSYLLYYASTRRSKLTKVCSFLEKRAARDVWRRRLGNIQVTFHILTALMEKVPRDLPIYARYVLSVIETVLRSQDISMVKDSIMTFETFCAHQDMASLAADQELSTQYQSVVRTYASFADTKSSSQANTTSSSPSSIRWRNAGLRALKGVASSDATLAADGGDSLKLILPVILENLYTGEEDVLVLLQSKAQKPEADLQAEIGSGRRVSVFSVQNADAAEIDPTMASQSTADEDRKAEMDVRLLALRCLEQIVVSGSTRGQIRVTAMTILRFILGKAPVSGSPEEKQAGGTWATSLMELMAKWCPVQVRFMILNAAMEVLLEINPTEENLAKSSTMVYLIDWILKSSVNMIGLSVIDVLLGLLQYISSVLSPGTEKAQNGTSAEKDGSHSNKASLSDQRTELLDLLVEAVGHLATHIYYGEQITDMIRTILDHLKTASQDIPATTATTGHHDGKSTTPPGETQLVAFSSPTAKFTALKAVKNILIVAGGKKRTASAGVESRNQVGIHVWEDTQWLLCEQRDVYYAYSDALLSWLRLETDEDDLRFKEPPAKVTQPTSKRELPDIAEKPVKRAASTSVNHRERAVHVSQSNFLRLLHLAIYEHALEQSSDESEMLLLHLLLTSMVERLGANAVRFGLPMILKLQSDITASSNPYSAISKVNLSSLVFGYLWELIEKFDLDAYRVGGAISNEIDKRKNFGVWLEDIHVPPVDLDGIAPKDNKDVNHGGLENPELLRPLGDEVYELVDRIEETYNTSIASPPQSPPSSPEQGSGHKGVTAASARDRLPPGVKDDMLSQWSKDTCLAAAQKDKARALSLSGSKVGTAMRNHGYANGVNHNDSSASTASPISAQRGGSGGSFGPGAAPAAGQLDPRRLSVPEPAGTSVNSSSRGPAVRVNELRRALSSNQDASNRRLSPLRGRLDNTNDDDESSSSESMVSGFSASEIDADGLSSRAQSVVETPEDGMETPRASTYVLAGIDGHASPNGVPPVPPLPPTISVPSIPGGFPSDSRTPTPMSERPVTAPGPRKQGLVNVYSNGTAGSNHASRPSTNILDRRKSRSNTMLTAVANADELAEQGDGPDSSTNGGGGHQRHNTRHQDTLSQFLSSHDYDFEKSNGKVNVSRKTNSGIPARKSAHGGIGRPPY